MNYMLKGLWLIEDGPYVGDTNFISNRPMLSRSSLRLVLKLFNNYYNFLATKRVPGNKTGPIDYIEHSVPLVGGDLGVMKLNRDEL